MRKKTKIFEIALKNLIRYCFDTEVYSIYFFRESDLKYFLVKEIATDHPMWIKTITAPVGWGRYFALYQVNVTAVFTLNQLEKILEKIESQTKLIISIFAGRIADAGIDPEPIMIEALKKTKNYPNIEILWASTRESFNIIQANRIGCDIITVSYDLLKKVNLFGKDLNEYSLETVKMFYKDALESGYSIKQPVKL